MKTVSLFLSIIYFVPFILSDSVNLEDYRVIYSCFDCGNYNYYSLLEYKGFDDYYINTTNSIINILEFSICFKTHYHVQIRITDPINKRWEVPYQEPFPFTDPMQTCVPITEAEGSFKVYKDPFSFFLYRKDTNETIFDSSAGQLIFTDHYLQISTSLPTDNIYGLGERAYRFDLGGGGTFTLFNKDQPETIEDGTSGHQLYGYHPVYLQREESYNFSLVLLRSSNAMNVIIEDDVLTYKILGGMLDFNIFFGEPNSSFKPAEAVIRQYHTYLNFWRIPPFWALGHQQSKWGYNNISVLEDVLKKYQENKIPVDVIWSDLDYMSNYINGKLNETAFPKNELNLVLKDYRVHWVPIYDAGIGLEGNLDLDQTIIDEVAIKTPDGSPYIGHVWPGKVFFVDFFNPKAQEFWAKTLDDLYQQVPYSGIWLDMNELANFADGQDEWSPEQDDIFNRPPYTPAGLGQMIYNKTVRLDAVHYGGLKEFDTHNLFGIMHSYYTFRHLKEKFTLPFILSRSTFYGSGRYNFHWTGDNGATWEFLRLSIPQIMSMNIFGIPFVGPDVCGFNFNATEELCARWYQLATFYPFFRNHNIKWGLPQEAYALGPTLIKTAQVSIELRYSLAKYYYSVFLDRRGLGTVFRPLFFEFYKDKNLFSRENMITDRQFMIGEALMVAPVLEPGARFSEVYFPSEDWFDYFTGFMIQKSSDLPMSLAYNSKLNSTVPLFIRGGNIVARQLAKDVMRIEDLDNKFHLVVALKKIIATKSLHGYYAKGSLMGIESMDGDSIKVRCIDHDCTYDLKLYLIQFDCGIEVKLAFEPSLKEKFEDEKIYIDGLTIFGDWSQELFRKFSPGSEGFFTKLRINKKESSKKILLVLDKDYITVGTVEIKLEEKIAINKDTQIEFTFYDRRCIKKVIDT